VIGYAWLISRVLEPRLTTPKFLSAAVWVENDRAIPIRNFSSLGPSNFLEWQRISREMKSLEADLAILGRFSSPVELVLNADHPSRYLVNSSRVELGIQVAASRNQVIKALIKSWLHQQTEGGKYSQLRTEVISDVLLAMIRGRFSLGVPGSEGNLEYGIGTDNWLEAAASYEGSCGSTWMPLELRDFCGKSGAVNPLAFRPLLGAMIFSVYDRLPLLQRVSFVRTWLDEVLPTLGTANESPSPGVLGGWKSWLRTELAILLPGHLPDHLPGHEEARALEIKKARLGDSDALKVDLVAFVTADRMKEFGSALGTRPRAMAPVEDREALQLLPGKIAIGSKERVRLITSRSVWVSCEVPTVLDVVFEPALNGKTLFVPGCAGDAKADFEGFLRRGTEGFALQNPEVPFIQVQRASLQLAVRRGALAPSLRLDGIVRKESGSRVSDPAILGVDQAFWQKEVKAFRVLGAIEAVEWFRSARAPAEDHPAESRSL
jgi:hypothetical protein